MFLSKDLHSLCVQVILKSQESSWAKAMAYGHGEQ